MSDDKMRAIYERLGRELAALQQEPPEQARAKLNAFLGAERIPAADGSLLAAALLVLDAADANRAYCLPDDMEDAVDALRAAVGKSEGRAP